MYKDANHVQEPGDSGSWAIDKMSNKLLGMLVGDCNITGEVFIMPAKTIFADIRLRLQASEVGLPSYRPNHSPKSMEIPAPTADHSSTIKQTKSQLAQQSFPSASAANVPTHPERRALTRDEEPMKDIPKAFESPWKFSRLVESTLDIGGDSREVRI